MPYKIRVGFNAKRYEADTKEDLVKILVEKGYSHKKAEGLVNLRATKIHKDFNPNESAKGVKTGVSFKDAIHGAGALVKLLQGKSATQEEINRRSGICNGCPLIATVSDCMGCGAGAKISKYVNDLKAKTFGGNYNIPNGLSKRYCGVCKCSLAVMLPSTIEAFEESEEKQSERPDFCWVKKSSINYKS